MRQIGTATLLLSAALGLIALPGGPLRAGDPEGPVATRAQGNAPAWKTIEDLPSNLRQRVDALHAARSRKFTPLDGTLTHFSVGALSLPEAVAKLSNDNNVLCGIEVIPWPSGASGMPMVERRRISLSLENTTPRRVLDALVALDPNFVWVEDRGVANVVMRTAFDSPNYPMSAVVPEFSVHDRPYTMVYMGRYVPALLLLQARGLVFSTTGRWPSEFEPKVTIETRGETVRAIINRVGREVGMSWTAVACKTQEKHEDIVWFHMEPSIEARTCGASASGTGSQIKGGQAK